MTLQLIQGLLLAFAIVVILMPPYIRFLRFIGMGKQIREEGPETHLVKQGTPTMGGLLVIAVVLGLYVLLRGVPEGGIIAPLAALAFVGALGAADDYFNARGGEGIRARQKLLWLVVVAAVAAFQIQSTYAIDAINVPFLGVQPVDPWVFIVFAALAIVAASNGVNITDGLDGLAGGTLVFAFVAFLLIALLNQVPQPDGTIGNQPETAFLCALIIGALLGFLWFNVHPAQVIMGDSGSLSLGATLAVIALITGQILVLPLIGLIFVVETASVIIQVVYFKLTGGRRIFRMSPIHHHFELAGWPEFTVIVRFWIIAGLCVAVGLGVFYADFIARGGLD
jgi:phospho-N-acetylmuramoyl-pentapeptide-transferase